MLAYKSFIQLKLGQRAAINAFVLRFEPIIKCQGGGSAKQG
jgi:hypothetical protein